MFFPVVVRALVDVALPCCAQVGSYRDGGGHSDYPKLTALPVGCGLQVDSNGYPPLETYREIASAPEISLCQWLDVIVPDTTMLVEVGVQVPRDAFQIFGSRKSVTSDPAI